MPKRAAAAAGGVSAADYQALASFRRALRHFLHFSAQAARDAGISPPQHQALLALKAFPADRPASIGDLAAHLHRKHHSVVGLIDRLVARGYVRRESDPADRRRVHVQLTPKGEAMIARLSSAHRDELRRLKPELQQLLSALGDQ